MSAATSLSLADPRTAEAGMTKVPRTKRRRLRAVGQSRHSSRRRAAATPVLPVPMRALPPALGQGTGPWRAADPWRAVAKTRRLRGRAVLLEADLAAALGTLPGRLADLVLRHADWFTDQACFTLTPVECAEQGLTQSGSQLPMAYTADGLVAAAHWLSNEALRAGDPYAEAPDLMQRFRIAWSVLGQQGGRA